MTNSHSFTAPPQDVTDHLAYDEDTGVFTRKTKVTQHEPGFVCGWIDQRSGYARLRFRCRIYAAHRLAWFFHYGAWPESEIDHINGNPADNRIANLRLATRSENARNCAPSNSTGLKGVHANKGRWRAEIMADGKRHRLGSFLSKEEAHEAYKAAAIRLHGEFARFE